jgi:hypothetical protein
MTREPTRTGTENSTSMVIKLETLHIAAAPRELAKRRLRLLPAVNWELPAAA